MFFSGTKVLQSRFFEKTFCKKNKDENPQNKSKKSAVPTFQLLFRANNAKKTPKTYGSVPIISLILHHSNLALSHYQS